MNLDEMVAFWRKSARLDRKTSEDLFRSKNYVGCLFFVHLYLEKALKGLVQMMTGKAPPFTHDLLVLARLGKLTVKEEPERDLATINTFNIRARYSDYKFAFYKKATKTYVDKYRKIAERLYVWFLNHY